MANYRDVPSNMPAPFGTFLWQNPAALAPMPAALYTGGYSGLIGGLVTAVFDGHTKAATPLPVRTTAFITNIGFFGAVGFAFGLVQSTVRDVRGKTAEDFYSSAAGGAVAGFMMGARRGSLSGMLTLPVLVGLTTGTLTGMGTSLARDDPDYSQPSPKDLQPTLKPRSAEDLEGASEKRWVV